MTPPAPYYRRNLALVHHLGFAFHAERCAPGILARLQPVLDAGGVVLELGCGSGLLTRELVAAGHRVIATDASPAMLDLARETAPGAEELRVLVLPDDPLPACDAVVSIGHVLSYLPDEAALDRALAATAGALRPGGVYAIDLCDLRWGEVRRDRPPHVFIEDEWAIFTRFAAPRPNLFVRDMTTFVRTDDGTWLRDDEVHENVLIDTSLVPPLLAAHGVDVQRGRLVRRRGARRRARHDRRDEAGDPGCDPVTRPGWIAVVGDRIEGSEPQATIEPAWNVLGESTAAHAEYGAGDGELFVDELLCSLVGQLRTAGVDETDGDVRIMRLTGHPFFVMTLFVPQAASVADGPHPLVTAFVRAAHPRD